VGLRSFFDNPMFELRSVTTSEMSTEFKWDVSTAEAKEKLWNNIVAESTWVSFGVEKLGAATMEEIKQVWIEKLDSCTGPDGFITTKMKHFVAVAVLESEHET
jgi:hypothetical protein